MRFKIFASAAAILCVSASLAHAQVTINTSNATDWKIANGSISLDWNSTNGSVFGIYLTGHNDNLVDTTHVGGNGQPSGLYMDNTGLGTGTVTASYHLSSGHYLDFWFSTASNSSNAFTYTQHFLVQPNDPTLYVYFVANHSSSDIAGSIGQLQYVFRISQSLFTHTYSVNEGLNNQAAKDITLPSPTDLNSTDPGRQVSNAVLDLHGFSLPSGFGREFYTKYDYSYQEYLHKVHGLYGSTYGAWTILPSTEGLEGGPTKQDLVYTDTILLMEVLSNHNDNGIPGYTPPQGKTTTRLFGPYGFHFNALGGSLQNAAELYQDAANAIPTALTLASNEGELESNGYVVTTGRGGVEPFISGGGSSSANTAWAVLSDQNKNMQYSSTGNQYWVANNSSGNATITGVVPGTYRLSAYVLGQWGQLREDGVTVTAANTTDLHGLTFKPENFSTSVPIWTIGTPDRSAHEFLHGGIAANGSGTDDREFSANWNYWSDFSANKGAVVYYATAVGSHAATNNLQDWNYVQWGVFDPGLFAGVYNSNDDTTDGYQYVIPSYVNTLSGHSGTNGVTTPVPPWQVHFTTTSAQQGQGQYTVVSVGLACTEASVTATLNGHPLTWHSLNVSDCMVRSGLSGYYQWVAYEFPTTDLNAAGADNVLALSVSQSNGVSYDALRMEITNTSANPSTTGWHDYEYVNNSTYVAANDAVSSNY
jgi:hypothetical protein